MTAAGESGQARHGGRPARDVALLVLVIAGLFHGRVLLSPLQEAVGTTLSLSDGEMAILQGPALTVPVALLALPIGLAIDHWRRTRLLILFALLGLMGAVATAFATGFGGLLGGRALAGLAASAANTIAFSIIADLVPPHMRGRSVMMISMGQYFGMASAFALGGILVEHVGAAMDGLRLATLLLGLPLVLAVAAAFALRDPVRLSGVRHRSAGQAFGDLWRERGAVFPVLATIAALEIALGALLVWAAPALSRGFALPPALIGSVLATGLVLSGIVGALGGGVITDLCQRRAGAAGTLRLLSGLLLVCAFASVFPFAPNALVAAGLLIIALTGLAAAGVMAVALYTIVIPPQLSGLAMALLAAIGVIAFGAAPPLVSIGSAHLGGPGHIGFALSIVSTVSCLLAVACLAIGRHAAARTPPLERSRLAS